MTTMGAGSQEPVVMKSGASHGRIPVEVVFCARAGGDSSGRHGAANRFLLTARGQPLVLHSTVMVDGAAQETAASGRGQLRRVLTGETMDYAEGEAAAAYGERLYRFRRRLFWVKPERVLIIVDELDAPRPRRFSWLLETAIPMEVAETAKMAHVHAVDAQSRLDLCVVVPERLELRVDDARRLQATTRQPSRRQRFLAVLAVADARADAVAWCQRLQFESEGRTLQGLGRDRLRLQRGATILELAQGPRAATDAAWWLLRQQGAGTPEHLVVGGRYFRRAGEEPVIQEADTFHAQGAPERQEGEPAGA